MAGARRRPAERAIIYGSILGGMTLDEVNELLASVGARKLVESSYRSVRKHYVPYFMRQIEPRLRDAIRHPPTWSGLKDAGEQDLPTGVSQDADPAEDE